MTSTRTYAGRTADERRALRRAALIEAGLDSLSEDGLGGVGVRTVCARARLTARYFYESFSDIDELLVAVSDFVGGEIATAALGGLHSPGDLALRTRMAIAAAFDVVLDDPRKACVVAVGSGHAGMNRARQGLLSDYADLVIAELDLLDPEHAGRLGRPIALFLVGGAVELVTAVITGHVQVSREDLVEQTARIFLAAHAAATGEEGPR